jgi:UDP-N-acetylglucosamine 2-epimerase (non-hydrolysing)
MKITIVSGARPNFMKIAPLVRAIDAEIERGANVSYRIVYTGNSEDVEIEAALYADLNIRRPDAYLGVNESNQIALSAKIMMAFDRELTANPANIVIVVDDLTATMSCTMVAKKHDVKVAHLVAGTHSFDHNAPKEVNRIVTDGLADYLFTAGMEANRNLNQAGAESGRIYHVGNILIDNIRYNRNRFMQPMWFSALGLQAKNYILLTLNRRALLADKRRLKELMTTLITEAKGRPIVVPVHNYVKRAIADADIEAPNLHLLQPQSYLYFGFLMNNADGVVTDSGNIAEETTFLGVPCITLNDYAEHPETWRLGTNCLVGSDNDKFAEALRSLTAGVWKRGELPERWDGRTAERIVKILLEKE